MTVAAFPAPGIHHGVSFDEYLGLDAYSNSRGGDLLRSPAYCRLRAEAKDDDRTPAKDFGALAHCALLEPLVLDDRYVVGGPCEAILKSGERKDQPCGAPGKNHAGGKWTCDKHGDGGPGVDRVLVSRDDHSRCQAIVAAVESHPKASRLLKATRGQREVTVVWTDPATGLLCKGRPDGYASVAGRNVLLDVKVTKDAHEDDFPRAIFGMGIHRQAELYGCGLATHGFKVDDYVIVAVMPDAPHEVTLYRLTDETLQFAAVENERLMKKYAACAASGSWPAHTNQVIAVGLPAWAKNRLNEETFDAVV